jgi:abortive infection bacteriophage resistance protein
LHPYRLLDPSDPSGIHRQNQVHLNTRFENVAALIDYDRNLRSVLLRGLQLVEVAINARVSHVLGARNPFAHTTTQYLDRKATGKLRTRGCVTKTEFEWWQDEYLRLETYARNETFVSNNLTKYGRPLPIWIACEFFDYGTTTRLFSFLLFADRTKIAEDSGLTSERTLRSWLTTMNYLRNICAHNSRLWNRRLIQRMQLRHKDLPAELEHLAHVPNDKIYPVIAITAYLTQRLCPDANWVGEARKLIYDFPSSSGRSVSEMGVPRNWSKQTIWNESEADE